MNTFLFYDLETSGLNKAFDQVLQFAAIRTDLELNELERHEIFVQLSADVIPSPAAILTHQISVTSMQQQGIPEIEAIQKIHQLLNTPGTISIGYNSLNFDDEFLRFSFYRHLLSPYSHQYANHCYRADLFPMVVTYYLFKNEILLWPKIAEKNSFKLDHLNQINKLCSGDAHNALVDVAVTVELAKRLRAEKLTWDYLLGYFNKEQTQDRILKFPQLVLQNQTCRTALQINGSLGHKLNYQAALLQLGTHKHYSNKTVWLRLDKPELSQTTAETIASNSWALQKKICEDGFLLPLNELYVRGLDAERQTLIADNKGWLLNNPELFKKISDYHRHYIFPKIPDVDASAALYEFGFLKDVELYQCEKFHKVAPEDKHSIIAKFTNPYLQEIGIRMLGRYYPDYLPAHYTKIYEQYLQAINPENPATALVDYRGEKRLTPQKALAEISQLRLNPNLNPTQVDLLNDLEQYLQHRY